MPRLAARIEQLTKARCQAMKPEPTRFRVTDAQVKALKFVVEPGGRKFWTVRYVTHDGKNSEKALGEWPAVLPDKARADAAAIRGAVRSDKIDPATAKREHRNRTATRRANTFQALTDAYLAASTRGQFSGRGRPKAESTIAKERQHLGKHILPNIGTRPIEEIKRKDIIALVEGVASGSGSGAANSCLEVIRRVFAYGRHRELLESNPALEIRPIPSTPRDVIASDGALKVLWSTLEDAKKDRTFKRAKTKPNEAYATAAVLQLSLLTLQRRGEVVAIRREDVDLEKNLWTIPAMNKKERRKGAVPLSSWAREILEAAFERTKGEWAFPGLEGEDHVRPKTVTRFMARLRTRDAERRQAAKERIKAGASLAGDAEFLASPPLAEITPHDLRRTGRTKLTGEELQIDEVTAERVLNHTVGSRQQNAYDWNSYLAPKRNALEAWAGELRRIVVGENSPSNVRRFGATRI